MLSGGSFEVDADIRLESDDVVSNETYTWITFYFFLTTLWTAFLVTLPVATSVGPDNYYAHHPGWYTGDDVIRFIEPIGGLLLNCLVMFKSGILSEKKLSTESWWAVGIYVLGCALYVQGGAFHSASNMYKNSLEKIQAQHDDDYYDALHYYMRTVWEHEVSHYVYAAGLVTMHAAQAWAYRNMRAPEQGLSIYGKLCLAASSGILAFLIFAVALQFPAGTIVGFIYLILYGGFTIGGYLFRLHRGGERRALGEFGSLPVIHHFFIAYVLSFIALVLWIIAKGGFESRSGNR
jgi:hypothetical protein